MYEYICIRCGNKQYTSTNFLNLKSYRCLNCGYEPIEYSVPELMKLHKRDIIEYYNKLMELRGCVKGKKSKLEQILDSEK